jgi:hypothetical protein
MALALATPSCGDDDDDTSGTGGKGTGGGKASGGNPSTGGVVGTGGSKATGGSGGSGATLTGGTAGTPSSGGTAGGSSGGSGGGSGGSGGVTGGTPNTGGTVGTGGSTIEGGSGGVPETGGSGGMIDTGGSGGAIETGGSGGVVETGGSGGIVETGGSGGAGGEGGGATPPPGVCANGCAVLSAPLADGVTTKATEFTINFNPVDLTGTSVTIRLCVAAGDALSAVHYFSQDLDYSGNYGVAGGYKTANQLQSCDVGMQDWVIPVAAEGTFDPATVRNITVQLAQHENTGPWITTTVYVDSVTTTGDAVGPFNFSSNASAFAFTGGVPGSTLTWLKN